jgi:hypothetical protein
VTTTVPDETVTVEPAEELASVLKVLDETGDTRITWNPRVRAEVDAARAHFNAMKEKRYLAYRVGDDDGRGEVIREFDPEAREIIMHPQMQGG